MPVFAFFVPSCDALFGPRKRSFEIYREACKFQGAFTPNVQVTTIQILHYVRQRNVSVRTILATQGRGSSVYI